MASLSNIQGIGKSSLALLNAAGFQEVSDLACADADDVAAALMAANQGLQLAKRLPAKANVHKWIQDARALEENFSPAQNPEIADEFPENGAPETVNYELREDVAAMLTESPFAIPLPSRVFLKHGLGPRDVPEAALLNRSGDLEFRIERMVKAKPVDLSPRNSRATAGDNSEFRKPSENVPALTRAGSASLIRAPRVETNRGKKPNSRFFIRGVLHTNPWRVWWGAIFTLLIIALIPLSIVSAMMLLLSSEQPKDFHWVPRWIIALPIAFGPAGIAYLLHAVPIRCRICGIRLLTRHSHGRNSKAHRLPFLGYVIPVCLHMLLFRWFRCPHCGTPVRLKE
ncbi:MAG: DUF4332 domain-containing protein [Verrucomicrobiota bacterium]